MSFLFKKNERAYILCWDGIKTDNWLKLLKLNYLQFRKKKQSFGRGWVGQNKKGRILQKIQKLISGGRRDYYLELESILRLPLLNITHKPIKISWVGGSVWKALEKYFLNTDEFISNKTSSCFLLHIWLKYL